MVLAFTMCSKSKDVAQHSSSNTRTVNEITFVYDSLIVMSYNVENFFHPDDDTLKLDDAFTPDGDYHWSFYHAKTKAKSIARVIASANGWNAPHIIGLCEVEGPAAVHLLLEAGNLRALDYEMLCFPTPDRRGVATALLYNSLTVTVLDAYPINVSLPEKEFYTRDVLYAKLLFARDTFHVMVNHWPSKYGGEFESMWKRNHVARLTRQSCDSILAISPEAKIIVMGDFNDDAKSEAIVKEFGATSEMGDFVNLSSDTQKSSYKFHGVWNTIDHIIVSRALCENKRPEFKVCDLPFLLEPDQTYSGEKPYRTYIGMTYNEGVSDHLPVMIKIPMK